MACPWYHALGIQTLHVQHPSCVWWVWIQFWKQTNTLHVYHTASHLICGPGLTQTAIPCTPSHAATTDLRQLLLQRDDTRRQRGQEQAARHPDTQRPLPAGMLHSSSACNQPTGAPVMTCLDLWESSSLLLHVDLHTTFVWLGSGADCSLWGQLHHLGHSLVLHLDLDTTLQHAVLPDRHHQLLMCWYGLC